MNITLSTIFTIAPPIIAPEYLDSDCPVCQERFLDSFGVIVTHDGTLQHLVHESCLRQWTNAHPICPLCREKITHINGVELPQQIVRRMREGIINGVELTQQDREAMMGALNDRILQMDREDFWNIIFPQTFSVAFVTSLLTGSLIASNALTGSYPTRATRFGIILSGGLITASMLGFSIRQYLKCGN